MREPIAGNISQQQPPCLIATPDIVAPDARLRIEQIFVKSYHAKTATDSYMRRLQLCLQIQIQRPQEVLAG